MEKHAFIECVDLVGHACKEFSGERDYISTGAVNVNHIDQSLVRKVDYSSKPSRANLVVKSGDILFAKMQGTKKTLFVNDELSKNIYSTGFFAVRPRNNILTTECLFYLLTSKTFLDQKDKYCSGATQKAITKKGLQNITVNLPPIEQQAMIAKKLEMISNIIKLRKSELTKLDSFVKARFVEMFGDPIRNEKGWCTKALEAICKLIVDCPHSTPKYTSENTGFMCIRTSIVKKNRIEWKDIEYISEKEYKQRIQRKKPEKGDIIYTREGAILGIAAVIDRDCNVALGQRSMLLSPNKKICTSEFLSVAMNFDSFLDKVLKGVSGTASPHINVGSIKVFKMILPPIEQQEKFSSFVHQVDKSKFALMNDIILIT